MKFLDNNFEDMKLCEPGPGGGYDAGSQTTTEFKIYIDSEDETHFKPVIIPSGTELQLKIGRNDGAGAVLWDNEMKPVVLNDAFRGIIQRRFYGSPNMPPEVDVFQADPEDDQTLAGLRSKEKGLSDQINQLRVDGDEDEGLELEEGDLLTQIREIETQNRVNYLKKLGLGIDLGDVVDFRFVVPAEVSKN